MGGLRPALVLTRDAWPVVPVRTAYSDIKIMKNGDSPHSEISLIADFEGDINSLFNVKLDPEIPIVPLRNQVLFPGIAMPVTLDRDLMVNIAEMSQKIESQVGFVCQREAEVEMPTEKDLYRIGTMAKVLRSIEMPDGRKTLLVQGFCRFKVEKYDITGNIFSANVKALRETKVKENDEEFKALAESCREQTERLMSIIGTGHDGNVFALRNMKNAVFMLNFICTNLPVPVGDKMDLLATNSIRERGYKLLSLLNREIQYGLLKASIRQRAQHDLDEQQKEYFLQQQIKNMQDELGDSPVEQEVAEMKATAEKKNLPDEVRKTFNRELSKLERLSPQNPDYNVQVNYLQTVLSLPWNEFTKDNTDLETAERTLNKDHYGLEKVKERILEHLAVIYQRGNFKSPIICLYGPPGIGKTSLGKSIAKAMKRKYVRVSLGGVHDEAEIRGHRRTYVGAMPGRIIQSLIKCGSSNPVFVLDEIDKISDSNINGNPTSALLEVLDPEQNVAFHDNFIDLDYDLSNILFIATANTLSTIPAPLLDRMELIEMSGYITEEKVEIAKRHLIPKEKEAAGFKKTYKLKFPKATLEQIIEQYTRESGVRQLEKRINEIFRKIAYRNMKGGAEEIHEVRPEDLKDLLGKPTYVRDIYQGNRYAGVVTGLAWTSAGGEILFIETSLSRGKGSKLTLTGNLGDVMKESAVLALEYIKAHASRLGIDHRVFNHWNIHIHVPEGAVPKDGPSAGITIATSIASALTQRKVRDAVAMTGEITLRGKVLPVGGIKEKILAAKRAGINTIILSKDNRRDIEEIPEIYLKGITFEYVENVDEVLRIALLDEKVENATILTVDDDDKDDEEKA